MTPVEDTAQLTRDERAALGKAARSKAPRSQHADWEAPVGRTDPVEVLLQAAEDSDQELVPIRFGRMLESPFTFFRGAASVMAADLATTAKSGLTAQLCGDAHLSNFGGFASPDRTLVFDINDFDETLPGPWEWDLKRLAASIEVAGRDLGLSGKRRRAAVRSTAREYREAMRGFAEMSNLEVWYSRLDEAAILKRWGDRATAKTKTRAQKRMAKARSKDSLRAFARLTHVVDGERRIISDPPLISPIEEWMPKSDLPGADEQMRELLGAYRRTLSGGARHLIDGYRYVHVARKVVGVGSVGTRALIVLLLGVDDHDPLFLQVKEATRSALEPHLKKSRFRAHGQRVIEGQWLIQAASDSFLGWLTATGVDGVKRDFYVRQLWDWKLSAEIAGMGPSDLAAYGEMCGWTLARAHARSSDRVALASYIGGGDAIDRALADFARKYADQNERDYGALDAAARSGRVAAEKGV